MATTSAAKNPGGDVGYLCRALKAPRRPPPSTGWPNRPAATAGPMKSSSPPASNERSPPAPQRRRAAHPRRRVPARKSLDEFDWDHQRSLKRDVIAHLATLDFVAAKDNVVFLGPPGTGKTHLAIGLSIRACHHGHRVVFATTAEWVDRLALAHSNGRLYDELRGLAATR